MQTGLIFYSILELEDVPIQRETEYVELHCKSNKAKPTFFTADHVSEFQELGCTPNTLLQMMHLLINAHLFLFHCSILPPPFL